MEQRAFILTGPGHAVLSYDDFSVQFPENLFTSVLMCHKFVGIILRPEVNLEVIILLITLFNSILSRKILLIFF